MCALRRSSARRPARATVLALLLAACQAGSVACGSESPGTRAIDIDQIPLPDGKVDTVLAIPEALNVAETADGVAQVTVECRDSDGSTVVRSRERWPFLRDGDPPAPHAHLILAPGKARSIAVCAVGGTSPRLEGRPGLGR